MQSLRLARRRWRYGIAECRKARLRLLRFRKTACWRLREMQPERSTQRRYFVLSTRQTPIPELLAKVSSNLGVDDASRFEFLIARQIDSGPELWHWSSALPNAAVEVETSMRIGSLASWHAEMSSALTTMFTQGNLDESRMLVVLAASIQSYGLRDSLMGQGVGGTVAAVRLSTDGPEWLPDTNYVVDLGQLSDIALVSVLIRENGVAVASSFSQDVRVMLNSVNHGTGRDWMRKWQASVRSQFALSASRLWIFLGTTNATLLIVDAEAVVTETPIFTVARSAEWGYTFGMHPLLKAVLEEPCLRQIAGHCRFASPTQRVRRA